MADLTKLEKPEMNLKTRFHSGSATSGKSQENPEDVAIYLIVSAPVDVNDLVNLFMFL